MGWDRGRFEKDDPWFAAKLAGTNARDQASVDTAAKRRGVAALEYEKLKAKGMNPDRFTAFKKSVDGLNRQWGHVRGRTLEECQDLEMYPPGLHKSPSGDFVWTYCLTECL